MQRSTSDCGHTPGQSGQTLSLASLIERLEKATGLDAELDGDVGIALNYIVPWFDTSKLIEEDQQTIRHCAAILASGKYTATAELRADAIRALKARSVAKSTSE